MAQRDQQGFLHDIVRLARVIEQTAAHTPYEIGVLQKCLIGGDSGSGGHRLERSSQERGLTLQEKGGAWISLPIYSAQARPAGFLNTFNKSLANRPRRGILLLLNAFKFVRWENLA